MQQEAADKLFGFQYHRLLLGIVAIILVAECDPALIMVTWSDYDNFASMTI